MNRPRTAQGAAVWALARDMGGQWRFATVAGPGGAATVPVGYDMTAVLAVAAARGMDMRAVAELLPAIEQGALSANRDRRNG